MEFVCPVPTEWITFSNLLFPTCIFSSSLPTWDGPRVLGFSLVNFNRMNFNTVHAVVQRVQQTSCNCKVATLQRASVVMDEPRASMKTDLQQLLEQRESVQRHYNDKLRVSSSMKLTPSAQCNSHIWDNGVLA